MNNLSKSKLACSYPLVPSALDEIKEAENKTMLGIQKRHDQEIKEIREEMNQHFSGFQ
ncbi:MAG: hypothetical protein WCF06_09250 [Nitrososphaeraceae archaeon]